MSDLSKHFFERERMTLSPYAFLSENTRGRDVYTTPCPYRTEFQRDRDRITHCKSFRRLMYKTQVFLLPQEDHYRTRLLHTLEVTQIARTMSRALCLNEDLAEAAALGHDLGHTPFGHAGEKILQQCYDPSFTHYKQSLRVVEKLENDGKGLNLTYEVRDGILNHSGDNEASTLEGRLIKYADRIAYINHDIDDAMRAGILTDKDIPLHLKVVLGTTYSDRINTMVAAVVEGSMGKDHIAMTPIVCDAMNEMRNFLFERVYTSSPAKKEDKKAQDLLESLFEHFCRHPEQMPEDYKKTIEEEGVERKVCDYISSMTDRYAINLYQKLHIPEVWK